MKVWNEMKSHSAYNNYKAFDIESEVLPYKYRKMKGLEGQ